jgi:hypothetical protein
VGVNDAVSLDAGPALRGTGLAAQAPVGSRVVRADGAACTVTATLGDDAVSCAVTGGWAAAQTFTVWTATTVLTDDGRAAAGAVPFTDLVPAGQVGATVHNTTREASCTVASRTATTVTCAAPLATSAGTAGEWRTGDTYRVDLPSATTLVDAGKGFDDMDLVGATLQNVTADNASCVVTATTAHSVTCAGLSGAGQWSPGDAYRLGGDAQARFNMTGYTYGGASDGPLEDYVADMTGSPLGDAPVDCGGGLLADACSRLSLAAEDGSYLGTLRYEADLDSDAQEANGVTLPKALTDAAAGEEGLEWSLLHAAVGQLKRYVADGLDGTLADEPLPMIGLDYTAGARLLDALDQLEVKLTAVSPPAFTAGKTTGAWEDELEKLLNDQLKTLDPALASLAGTASVTLYCDTESKTPCSRSLTDGTQINDLRVDFAIGQNLTDTAAAPGAACDNCGGTTHALEFDPGLEDLPVRLTGAALEAKAGWRFAVSFGLDRANGPYLGGNAAQTEPELQLGAQVRLPDTATPCSVPRPAAFSGFSPNRCVAATLGLFQGVVYDGAGSSGDLATGDDRSQLDLTTTVDIGSSDRNADGKVGALDQLDGLSASATVEVAAKANVDLAFLTGVSPGGDIPASALPSIRGQVHVGFDSSAVASATTVYNLDGTSETVDASGVEHWTDVSYDNLAIDPGSSSTTSSSRSRTRS